MLKQRVITAIIMLVILLAALLAPSPMPLILLLALIAACALWEWLRLTWPTPGSIAPAILAILAGAGLLLVCIQWIASPPQAWTWSLFLFLNAWLMPLVCLFWLFGATFLVLRGNTQTRGNGPALSLFGVLAVLATWTALVQLFPC